MKHIIGISLVLAAAMMNMGCAAQSKCLRDVHDLEAQGLRQDQEIRDLEARVAVIKTQQAGTTMVSLAEEGFTAAQAALGWATSEAPIAYQQASQAYDYASTRMTTVRECFHNHGADQTHTFEEYREIAAACFSASK